MDREEDNALQSVPRGLARVHSLLHSCSARQSLESVSARVECVKATALGKWKDIEVMTLRREGII